jgi:hypothetical protein
MNFRRWLMKEMGHIEVDGDLGGKHILAIDPMFENYPKVNQRDWHSGQYDFFGKIPGTNRYLLNKPDGSPAVMVMVPPMNAHPLPTDWWDYARVYFEDGSVKEPTKP